MNTERHSLIHAMIAAVFTMAAVTSCIPNDIPPPIVKGAVVEFVAEGQNGVSIDALNRTVAVDLAETVDLSKVRITKLTLSETAGCVLGEGSVIDLSSPLKVMVKTAAEYEWTITATQTVERRFVIENQVGEAYFETGSRNVFAYVPKGTDLTRIHVLELKLGPGGITEMEPDLTGKVVSFRATSHNDANKVREVAVTCHGRTETWSLFVTETATQLNRADAFARRVYLAGSGLEDHVNGFIYRRADGQPVAAGEGDDEGWVTIPDADIQHHNGVFTTCLRGLEPETEYIVRAFSGDDFSPEQTFTTEGTRELPGGDFDKWHQAGKVWNPWPADGTQWWDTGNEGATTLGGSNSTPTDEGKGCPRNPAGRAAHLESKFVGVAMAGRVAGGNIYFGKFAETNGTNGKVDIGWSWQHRPTKLKGYYKYFPKPITDVGKLQEDKRDEWLGKPDTLNIVVSLWASPDGQTRPFQVNTDPNNFVDFYEYLPGVQAYGRLSSSVEQAEWTEFEIELDYKTTSKLPANTVLFLMATASKNCNYFTAGRGSLLYLDELWLEYD